LTLTGFYAFFTNQFGGPIFEVGWYIGLIISLYLLYPFIANIFDKNPHRAIIILFIISVISRVCCGYLQENNIGYRLIDWFPLCRVFEFGIGIYLVRTGLYPHINLTGMTSKAIIFLGELSFYIFLVHNSFMKIGYLWGWSLYYIISSFILIILLSIILYMTDNFIQNKLTALINKKNKESIMTLDF
jgi:peptidoglycan/LPS O-acetylase OafA/YrhL